MKTFHCDVCGSLVFFENTSCLKCGHVLGFLPSEGALSALEPAEQGNWKALASGNEPQYRQCGNIRHACNWMVGVNDPEAFCVSCRLDELIPNLDVAGNEERWRKLETAKRRALYTLLKTGLPIDGVPEENRPSLRFRFVADVPGAPPETTGHENGMITVNIAEADDAERERRRVSLHEPFRTLLGHFRHEVAHYYWERLITDSPWLERWRKLFGDENRDYGAALKSYYQQGPPAEWQSRYVSAYASSHPWEDWAETWAHYLHITDMVETAASFGVALKPKHPAAKSMTADPKKVGGSNEKFDQLLEYWFPLTYAVNSLNRGMGLPDVYPFVLSSPAIEKLRFVHEVMQDCAAKGASFKV